VVLAVAVVRLWHQQVLSLLLLRLWGAVERLQGVGWQGGGAPGR
jgi:hypothetical protein